MVRLEFQYSLGFGLINTRPGSHGRNLYASGDTTWFLQVLKPCPWNNHGYMSH